MIETGIICNFAKKKLGCGWFLKKISKKQKTNLLPNNLVGFAGGEALGKNQKKKTMKIPIFPGKYYQNGGFSMAMLVYRRVGYIILH